MKAAAIWIPGLLLAAIIAARVDPRDYAGGRSRDDAARLRRNSSAVAQMLGGFRTSMSDFMYIKTELYLHGGVGYAPHRHDEVASSAELAEEAHASHDGHGHPHAHAHEHEHPDGCAGTPTLIPEADRDFRGFVGRLHRQVKPWRDPGDPHILADGRELLPWFRLMTASDPQYIRGYVAGAFWLQREDRDAAFAFVEEGLAKNPDSFQLLVSRGLLRLKQARQIGTPAATSLEILEAARQDFLQGAELALLQRPAGIADEDIGQNDAWERYQENDALAACQLAATLTRTLGDPEGAAELARRYRIFFPDSAPLREAAELD